ncbi:MAG: hypothetical protein R3E93_08220 [Thiothrix sp.]
MKTQTLTRTCPSLLLCLSIAWLSGCEKRDETPPPVAGEQVIIPESDALQPLPAAPATADTPAPADTSVDTQATVPLQPPNTRTAPEANMAKPEQSNKLKIPAFTQQVQSGSLFRLRFLASGESFYTEIKLENNILSYTYFEDTAGRCEKWVQNTPCWRKEDLKTISMALRDEDLDNLYSLAKESGILKLTRATYGSAKQGQRYYTQRMEISLDGKQKSITYQSFPGSSKKPEAFSQLETALVEYARDLPH